MQEFFEKIYVFLKYIWLKRIIPYDIMDTITKRWVMNVKKKILIFGAAVLVLAIIVGIVVFKNFNGGGNGSVVGEVRQSGTLGDGKTEFPFEVIDPDGKTTEFIIKTDKTTVGDALCELNLISGEEGAYGLYVKTVNGIKLDYNEDGMYWAFYINGKYATTGVDKTEIKADALYTFRAE